jgi:predicted MFS family arabinose efflux permease
MWLKKSIYESLPYYYVAVGLFALLGTLYVNYWYWPIIGMTVGLGSILAGLVVWLRRRDYRAKQARVEGKVG